MKKPDMRQGAVVQGMLLASVFIAFASFMGFLIAPSMNDSIADMRIEPAQGVVKIGETFVVTVAVSAQIPVNVFKGEVKFDPNVLAVDSIDYNTSIADLWAEVPWYENGEGTVNFAGGTTHAGGFLGTGSLITITFRAHANGDTLLQLVGARILEHNGLGTDVTLKAPIDALFNVEESVIAEQTVASPVTTTVSLAVVPERPSTDLNGDGKHTIADVSIFMLNMLGDDKRYDFNMDGKIDSADMSILMSSK